MQVKAMLCCITVKNSILKLTLPQILILNWRNFGVDQRLLTKI